MYINEEFRILSTAIINYSIQKNKRMKLDIKLWYIYFYLQNATQLKFT